MMTMMKMPACLQALQNMYMSKNKDGSKSAKSSQQCFVQSTERERQRAMAGRLSGQGFFKRHMQREINLFNNVFSLQHCLFRQPLRNPAALAFYHSVE